VISRLGPGACGKAEGKATTIEGKVDRTAENAWSAAIGCDIRARTGSVHSGLIASSVIGMEQPRAHSCAIAGCRSGDQSLSSRRGHPSSVGVAKRDLAWMLVDGPTWT